MPRPDNVTVSVHAVSCIHDGSEMTPEFGSVDPKVVTLELIIRRLESYATQPLIELRLAGVQPFIHRDPYIDIAQLEQALLYLSHNGKVTRNSYVDEFTLTIANRHRRHLLTVATDVQRECDSLCRLPVQLTMSAFGGQRHVIDSEGNIKPYRRPFTWLGTMPKQRR